MSLRIEKNQVIELLFAAVDDLNLQLRQDQRVQKSLETPLVGPGGRLDSLGLLNLLVLAEQRIETAFGVSVMLADDEAMGREPSPFRHIDALADHALTLLQNRL